MIPDVQFFRYEQKLTACALGEPSLTLVRNDAQFGLLISGGAHEEPLTSSFHLEEVAHLCISGRRWFYTEFDSVAIFQREGVWLAQDTVSRRYFPNPSDRPYSVIFISFDEFRRLQSARAEGIAFPVFESAQKHFGQLPGFLFRDNFPQTPDDYATRGDAVSPSEYVPTTC